MRSTSPPSTAAGRSGSPGGERRSRMPSPLGFPIHLGGSRFAVALLITISPASAVDSISVTVVACLPVTTNSRWVRPTTNRWNGPEWTPIEIRRLTRPLPVTTGPRSRSAARIRCAARQARTTWSGPLNSNSSASPPNFKRSPPSSTATPSNDRNVPFRISVSSSAPALPSSASFSDSLVNPDTSAKSRVPCSTHHGSRRAPSATSRGTNGVNPDAERDGETNITTFCVKFGVQGHCTLPASRQHSFDTLYEERRNHTPATAVFRGLGGTK